MESLIVSLRLVAATLLICVVGYTGVILGIGQLLASDTAQGSLILRADGTVAGSRLIAQKFEKPEYFWSRPSAVDYNGAGAGGSNKSPTSSDLTDRAQKLVTLYGANADRPLPAELAAASGGGLDPHITERAALYQAQRIAQSRRKELSQVEVLIRTQAFSPGAALTPDRLVNVLELNLALDHVAPMTTSPATAPAP